MEALKHYQPEPVALLPEAPYHGGLVMGIVAKLSNKHLMMLNTFRVWYRVPGEHRRRRVVVEREHERAEAGDAAPPPDCNRPRGLPQVCHRDHVNPPFRAPGMRRRRREGRRMQIRSRSVEARIHHGLE